MSAASDLRCAAARVRAAATLARTARDLGTLTQATRDRLTGTARYLNEEADWLIELAGRAEQDLEDVRRARGAA